MDEVDELLAQAPPVPLSDAQVMEWLTAHTEINARHAAAATILMTDQAARAEPEVAEMMVQHSGRLAAMLEVFGSPDRTTTISVLGAICLPVVRGAVQPADAGQLAARVLPLLRPTTVTAAARRGA